MMDDFSTVTFDGQYGGTWYVASDDVEYLGEGLVNGSNHTIYLYKNFRQGTNTEYISIDRLSYPLYHPSSGYNTVYITNASNIRYNSTAEYYREHDFVSFALLVFIAILVLIKTFVRR